MITGGLSNRISVESFITSPNVLRNAEAERLSTPNILFTTFVFFSVSCNAECVHWYFAVHKHDQI